MAAATIVNTQYGYYVGDGGTDATTVTTSMTQIKGIICVAAASASTITVTEAGTARSLVTFLSIPGALTQSYNMHNLKADGVIVTLNTTSADRCIIVVE